MNYFERVLQLLREQSLTEMSDRGSRFSLFILKCLCRLNSNHQIETAISGEFPIDADDVIKLTNCVNDCERITNIKFSTKALNENKFPSNEDYPLSILNKYFASTNRKRMRLFLTLYSIKIKITEDTIYDLYTKFHSSFNK